MGRNQDASAKRKLLMPEESASAMSDTPNPGSFGHTEDRFAWPFLFFAVTGVFLFAFLTPPFQVPDEDAGFLRAEEVSRGELISERRYIADASRFVTGGYVDSNAVRVVARFNDLKMDASNRLSGNALVDASRIQWGGQTTFHENQASFYPPHLYLPGAFAIRVGKSLGLGIVDTLLLVRITNGLLATLLGFVALRLATVVSPLLFVVLLMPMSLFEMTSASQDSLVIGTSALAVALVSRIWLGATTSTFLTHVQVLCLTALIVAASAAKPNNAPLLLLLLAPLKSTQSDVRLRWTCFALGLIVVAGWRLWTMNHLSSPTLYMWKPTLDPSTQLADVLAHPSHFLKAVWHAVTWKAWESPGLIEYWQEFIGVLQWLWYRGWHGAFFPTYFYGMATAYMLIALLACALTAKGPTNTQRLSVVLASAGGVILTFLSMYLLFTEFRGYTVQGVQGRYFIPISMLLGLLVAGMLHSFRARDVASPDLKKWLAYLLLTWPLIALPFSARILVFRYYIS